MHDPLLAAASTRVSADLEPQSGEKRAVANACARVGLSARLGGVRCATRCNRTADDTDSDAADEAEGGPAMHQSTVSRRRPAGVSPRRKTATSGYHSTRRASEKARTPVRSITDP